MKRLNVGFLILGGIVGICISGCGPTAEEKAEKKLIGSWQAQASAEEVDRLAKTISDKEPGELASEALTNLSLTYRFAGEGKATIDSQTGIATVSTDATWSVQSATATSAVITMQMGSSGEQTINVEFAGADELRLSSESFTNDTTNMYGDGEAIVLKRIMKNPQSDETKTDEMRIEFTSDDKLRVVPKDDAEAESMKVFGGEGGIAFERVKG